MARIKEVQGLSLAQRTGNTYGTATALWETQDLERETHDGFMASALLKVRQTAGTGNTAGQYFSIHLEGSLDGSTGWTKLPHTTDIQLTTNGAAEYAATVNGPLTPWVRVAAEITGTPDATFQVDSVALA